jgi:hypothetical protein
VQPLLLLLLLTCGKSLAAPSHPPSVQTSPLPHPACCQVAVLLSCLSGELLPLLLLLLLVVLQQEC